MQKTKKKKKEKLTWVEAQESPGEEHLRLHLGKAGEALQHERHGQQVLHEAHVALKQKEFIELVGAAIGWPGAKI